MILTKEPAGEQSPITMDDSRKGAKTRVVPLLAAASDGPGSGGSIVSVGDPALGVSSSSPTKQAYV